jgi:hypothetical protein
LFLQFGDFPFDTGDRALKKFHPVKSSAKSSHPARESSSVTGQAFAELAEPFGLSGIRWR